MCLSVPDPVWSLLDGIGSERVDPEGALGPERNFREDDNISPD